MNKYRVARYYGPRCIIVLSCGWSTKACEHLLRVCQGTRKWTAESQVVTFGGRSCSPDSNVKNGRSCYSMSHSPARYKQTRNVAIANRSRVSFVHRVTTVNFKQLFMDATINVTKGIFFHGEKHIGHRWWGRCRKHKFTRGQLFTGETWNTTGCNSPNRPTYDVFLNSFTYLLGGRYAVAASASINFTGLVHGKRNMW